MDSVFDMSMSPVGDVERWCMQVSHLESLGKALLKRGQPRGEECKHSFTCTVGTDSSYADRFPQEGDAGG
eukprot:3902341-Alexandrium_andersonii.AAC.1